MGFDKNVEIDIEKFENDNSETLILKLRNY